MQGCISSATEVVALCGFVFGVACKLPPSLTILLLNGVFWVVIARHLFWDILYKRNSRRATEYHDLDEDSEGGAYNGFLKHKFVPVLEFVAFLMQLSALIAIPILLASTEDVYKNTDKYMTMFFLIPVTLSFLSVVWSGWLQKYLVEPRSKRHSLTGEPCIARMKSGKY